MIPRMFENYALTVDLTDIHPELTEGSRFQVVLKSEQEYICYFYLLGVQSKIPKNKLLYKSL